MYLFELIFEMQRTKNRPSVNEFNIQLLALK